jgi:hypothetical protein
MSAGGSICTHLDQIEVTALPDKIDGCEECLKIRAAGSIPDVHDLRQDRLHDSSPNKHATTHERERPSDHRSAEPGQDWSWCYIDEVAFAFAPR